MASALPVIWQCRKFRNMWYGFKILHRRIIRYVANTPHKIDSAADGYAADLQVFLQAEFRTVLAHTALPNDTAPKGNRFFCLSASSRGVREALDGIPALSMLFPIIGSGQTHDFFKNLAEIVGAVEAAAV